MCRGLALGFRYKADGMPEVMFKGIASHTDTLSEMEDEYLKFEIIIDDSEEDNYAIELDESYYYDGKLDVEVYRIFKDYFTTRKTVKPKVMQDVRQWVKDHEVDVLKALLVNTHYARFSNGQDMSSCQAGEDQYMHSCKAGKDQYMGSCKAGENQYMGYCEAGKNQDMRSCEAGEYQDFSSCEAGKDQYMHSCKAGENQDMNFCEAGKDQYMHSCEAGKNQYMCSCKAGENQDMRFCKAGKNQYMRSCKAGKNQDMRYCEAGKDQYFNDCKAGGEQYIAFMHGGNKENNAFMDELSKKNPRLTLNMLLEMAKLVTEEEIDKILNNKP